jgi:hypothetical protein
MMINVATRRPAARLRVLAVASTLAFGSIAGCTSSSTTKPTPVSKLGVILGEAPTCYGPGVGDNLKPHITIRATPINGGTPTAIHIATSDARRTYRMTLLPGTYKISTYTGSITVRVRPGATISGADLPVAGCI